MSNPAQGAVGAEIAIANAEAFIRSAEAADTAITHNLAHRDWRPNRSHVEGARNAIRDATKAGRALLALASPRADSDERTAGEARAWPASYQETFDAIAAATKIQAGMISVSVRDFYRALSYPDRPATPAQPASAAKRMTGVSPKAMLLALDRFTLRVLSRDVEPRDDDTWAVIDTKTADPETNWPGELVSEHATHAEARVALMRAALASATPAQPAGAVPDSLRPALVETVAQHIHDEEHRHEGYNWTWPEYADDDGRRGNSGYVSITPPVVQMECREAAERLVCLFERYTPAQPAGAVPDSLRALSEVKRGVVALRDQARSNLAFYEEHGSDLALLESQNLAAYEAVLGLFASHPAGQSAEELQAADAWLENLRKYEHSKLARTAIDTAKSAIRAVMGKASPAKGEPPALRAAHAKDEGAEDRDASLPSHILAMAQAMASGRAPAWEKMRYGPCVPHHHSRSYWVMLAQDAEAALATRPAASAIGDLGILQQAAEAGRLRIECRERPNGADPDAGMVWPIEVELSCINGLSAWFTLGNIYSPDRAAQGYTDGALSDELARSFAAHIVRSLGGANASLIVAAVNRLREEIASHPAGQSAGSGADSDLAALAEAASVPERAYGVLWRLTAFDTGQIGYAHDARKVLLAAMDKEGQRRGIAWATRQYGPLGPNPRFMLSDEDRMEMGL